MKPGGQSPIDRATHPLTAEFPGWAMAAISDPPPGPIRNINRSQFLWAMLARGRKALDLGSTGAGPVDPEGNLITAIGNWHGHKYVLSVKRGPNMLRLWRLAKYDFPDWPESVGGGSIK